MAAMKKNKRRGKKVSLNETVIVIKSTVTKPSTLSLKKLKLVNEILANIKWMDS